MFKLPKLLILLPIFIIFSINSLSAFAATHQYDITLDETISIATVTICFDGKAPDFLTLDSKYANRDLVKLPESNQGLIEIQGRYWKTKNLPENACLAYRVTIERHHAKRTKAAKTSKNIAYLESNTWLWLPEAHSKHDDHRWRAFDGIWIWHLRPEFRCYCRYAPVPESYRFGISAGPNSGIHVGSSDHYIDRN